MRRKEEEKVMKTGKGGNDRERGEGELCEISALIIKIFQN